MDQTFFQKIEEASTITIFRHIRPDGDAFGSQFGLKQWIQDQYPHKKVFALGLESSSDDFFPASDKATDEEIAQSLALVLDCSNESRIDDQRYPLAPYLIRVDHHPQVEDFGDYLLIDPKKAATCELLGDLFYRHDAKTVSLACATYLYRGLLTDTLGYRTTNTTSDTLRIGSFLVSKGLNVAQLNQEMFNRSLVDFQFCSCLRSHLTMPCPGFGYAIATIEDYTAYHLTEAQVSGFVSEFGNIKELEVWALFTEFQDEIDGHTVYRGSLRSKNIPVNELASRYNGGGHKNAAGIGRLESEALKDLIGDIQAALAQK